MKAKPLTEQQVEALASELYHRYALDDIVAKWVKGFASRVNRVTELIPDRTPLTEERRAITTQYAKVLGAINSALRTNGKTRNNLRLSARKLNDMLCSVESTLRNE